MDAWDFRTLRVDRAADRLYVWLNRPDAKNAIDETMATELAELIDGIEGDDSLRVIVLRGDGGLFCAGGDIKGFSRMFAAASAAVPEVVEAGILDPIAQRNRAFGDFLVRLERIPKTTIAVVEGAAFGGGLGLVCVCDVTLGLADARFALSETGLGLPPAQIAPFVVRRLGLARARRIALTGARFDGVQAHAWGLLDELASDAVELDERLERFLREIGRCAIGANAATKQILFDSIERPIDLVLDDAARAFSTQLRGWEGREGVTAFLEKRSASWVPRKS